MIFMNKLTLLASFMMLSNTAYAVENGTPVSEADYQEHNYIVNIINKESGSACGAQLIAGNWLLTARHCTPYYSSNRYFGDDPAYIGEPMELKIYQGVEGKRNADNLVYEDTALVYTYGGDTEGQLMMDEYAKQFQHVADYVVCNSDYGCGDNNLSASGEGIASDVALIKLNKAIPYNNTIKLKQSHDYQAINEPLDLLDYDSNVLVDTGDKLVFRGFGRDENNVPTSQMMQGTMSLLVDSFSYDCDVIFNNGDFESCTAANLTNAELQRTILDIEATSVFEFAESPQDVNSGDSGTGIYTENHDLIGIASRDDSDGGLFVGIDMILPWIKTTIEGINSPKIINLGKDELTHTVTIQNLSNDDIALDPAANKDGVTLTHTCGQVLQPLSVCEITVTLLETLKGKFAVSLTNDREISFEEKIETLTPTDPPSNGGSGGSGGSVGIFFFPCLFLTLFLRRNKLKN